MYYILDGNNILKSTPEFLRLADGNFVRAQHELVMQAANVLCGSSPSSSREPTVGRGPNVGREPTFGKNAGGFATVFFDGMGLNYKFRPPTNAKIIFSEEKSADSLIIEEMKRMHNLRIQGKTTARAVVVSDDREIREAAMIFGAERQGTKEFTLKLFPSKERKPCSPGTTEKKINPSYEEEITEELKKYFKQKGL